MGLWVCIELDPEDVEPPPDESLFALQSIKGKGKGVRGTDANAIVPGEGLVCQDNVAWVNAIVFDLLKLSRGSRDYFYCCWVGFDDEYYEYARNRGESAPKFRTQFNMQLVSDAYLLSQPGLSFQGSKGELQMAFSSDKAVTPRDEPNVGVRETITSEGGVAPVARSTPVVLQPLGDPLVEDTLPSGTPDEDCLKMSLRNQDGEVGEVKKQKASRDHHRPKPSSRCSMGEETRFWYF